MAVTILDIDGVINAFYGLYFVNSDDPKYARIADYSTSFVEHAAGHKTRVFINEAFIKDALNQLASLSRLVWGTAWEHNEAQDLFTLLGRDEVLEAVHISREDVGLGTWKIRSIAPFIELLPEDEKVVWIEDELEPDAFRYAEARGNMLCIKPNPEFGLTEEELGKITEFLS